MAVPLYLIIKNKGNNGTTFREQWSNLLYIYTGEDIIDLIKSDFYLDF